MLFRVFLENIVAEKTIRKVFLLSPTASGMVAPNEKSQENEQDNRLPKQN